MIAEIMSDWKWYTALLLFTAVSFGAYGIIVFTSFGKETSADDVTGD